MDDLVAIRDILHGERAFAGWLYLPPQPWTPDTQGVFVKRDKDADPAADDPLPDFARTQGWDAVLEAADVEDIVCNVREQVDNPSDGLLFDAFVFYVDNDAFVDLLDCDER